VAPLQAALPLAEVDDPAMTVGEDLYLDVPGCLDERLDEQRVVAEGPGRLTPGRGRGGGQLAGVAHQPHPLAATAGRRLEQDRVADLAGGLGQVGVGHARLGPSRHDRHPRRGHGPLRRDLVTHDLDRVGRRPHEHDAGRGAGAGEPSVLRQEPVAGVHRLSPRLAGGGEDARSVQVTLPGGRRVGRAGRAERAELAQWPDADGEVGLDDVTGAGVVAGEHGHRADAELAQRADHPDGDLAPVGDQHRVEHPAHVCLTSVSRPDVTSAAHIRKTP
jgi:hypothetical protein